MLEELNVAGKTYFVECTVKEDTIEYLLYDSNENWTAVKTQEDVLQTLQLLNKRIKYDVTTAYDTLQNMQPESANWVESDCGVIQLDAPIARERILKLKYRVKGCPFKFEWILKRGKSLTIPLPVKEVTNLVDRLPVYIEELLEVLRRKEEEIIQYRMEYGSLRRSTVATNPFDVNKFRERYAATDMKVKILKRLIVRWRAEHGEIESTQSAEIIQSNRDGPANIIKKEETEPASLGYAKKVLESPRNRKRRAKQEIRAQMTRTLQARRQKLEYESQGQTLSESDQLQDTKEVMEEQEKPTSSGALEINRRVRKLVRLPKMQRSKRKKLSPPADVRPNTRQRRREYETHQNSPSDLMFIESPNMVYTADESAEPVKINGVKSAIGNSTSQNLKNKLYTWNTQLCKTHSMDKLQQPKNDLNAYVDNVLSQLDAFDKELKAQISSAGIKN